MGKPADRSTHYVYEPGTFVPLAQAVRPDAIALHREPDYAGDYDIDDDPLWTEDIAPQPFDAIAWYQCAHLGTPQELTDETGEIAWSAQYRHGAPRARSSPKRRARRALPTHCASRASITTRKPGSITTGTGTMIR